MKKISIVTPCYNEAENVEECHRRVRAVFAQELTGYCYEHIFADNDSRDDTPKILTALAARDRNVKVIFNARNFGPMQSNFHALMAASGDAIVVFLPADLQDPPELIPAFVRHWEAGNDIVYGIRSDRPESLPMRAARSLFYRFVAAWTPFPVPRDAGEFQLIGRPVLEALRTFEDHYPYIRGMIAYCGFRAVGVPFTWQARERGKSKASLLSYLGQGMNGLISFNNFPLRFCMVLGLTMSVLSMAYGLYSLVAALVSHTAAPPGIATLIVAQFFLSGVLLFVIGVLSEYIYAIYSLVRRRPLVVERGRLNFDAPDASTPGQDSSPPPHAASH